MLSANDSVNLAETRGRTGPDSLNGNGRKVIVIDDDELTRVLINSLLRESGFQALTAASGAEGLAFFRQHPDTALVITDMAMPGMDGLDVILALQRIDPKLRIMAISGFMPEANRVPKNVLFLSKPFEKASFFRTVQAALA